MLSFISFAKGLISSATTSREQHHLENARLQVNTDWPTFRSKKTWLLRLLKFTVHGLTLDSVFSTQRTSKPLNRVLIFQNFKIVNNV